MARDVVKKNQSSNSKRYDEESVILANQYEALSSSLQARIQYC